MKRVASSPCRGQNPSPAIGAQRQPAAARGSPDAARRLFAMSQPIAGTLAERYLAGRGILLAARERALRFHPGCYYRDLVTGETLTLPALIAAVTSLDGRITGLQRTWLDPAGNGKAQLADPRRSLGPSPWQRHLARPRARLRPSRSWPPARASRRWRRSAR